MCSRLLCAEVSRSDALDSKRLCSSKRVAIEATSFSVFDDSSVRRCVLESTSRAELAKVCAARSVLVAKPRVLLASRSSTPDRFSVASSISSLS